MIFMKKMIAAVLCCTLSAAGYTAIAPTSLSAADAVEESLSYAEQKAAEDGVFESLPTLSAYTGTSSYKLILQPERTFVSSEELESGEVHIRTNVYFQGDSSLEAYAFLLGYSASDETHIYFDNSLDIYDYGDSRDCTYSGGSYTSRYPDFCFGSLTVRTGEFRPTGSIIGANVVYERMNGGGIVYSDGNGGVYFTRSCNKMVDGVKTYVSEKVEISADQIQVHEDGSATVPYTYIEQDEAAGFPEVASTIELPHYDATLAEGTPYDGANDSCYWSSGGTTAASFLGYADEFPCFSFDIVLKQGTPNGTYSINLNENCRLAGSDYLMPLQLVDTAITVGTTSATITEDKTSPYYCFFAENDQEIRLNQTNGTILSSVSYADGSSEVCAVESLATCGQSPAELYAGQSEGAYIGDVAFTLEDQPLQQADGSTYTKTLLIGKKGDANLDGTVDTQDAVCILTYYAKKAAGQSPKMQDSFTEEQETLSYFLSDIDTCSQNQGADGGELSVEDAVQILTYYAEQAAGQSPTWSNR